ncbi:hypothetical protein [Spirosoma montaniterrae]|uniref:Uncharacterized protein n=1 Tax=Spirosoma montaniterrae TaxID=1178516 RepID=A0A1P9WW67_9BACT|nr:hypothetical protein [Spirosoma montaniterrae]AQG79632.1 hypothetical protein AWR27_10010 [Spirosoma montaniterrae]
MKRSTGCLAGLGLLILVSLVYGGISFYGGKWIDRYQQPWAYSTSEPILVGQWQCQFKDPDGVAKTLSLTIGEPTTDDERWDKAFSKRKRRSRTNKRAFDGMAEVSSRLGREPYEIWGSVTEDDMHQLNQVEFRSTLDKGLPKPNFFINLTKNGHWDNNALLFTLVFSYRRPDGSSFWSSDNPRFNREIPVRLARQ